MIVDSSIGLIESHANRLQKSVDLFLLDLKRVVDETNKLLMAHLQRSLEHGNGLVAYGPRNAAVMLGLDREYSSSLSIAGYHAVVSEFVSNFSEQLDEFEPMYRSMRESIDMIPSRTPITEADGRFLATRAAMSLSALEAASTAVAATLHRSSTAILGEVPLQFVLDFVSDIVDKTGKVGPTAKDLKFSFFRTISAVVYRNIEAGGVFPKYRYAGEVDAATRDFCRNLAVEGAYTSGEIAAMSNGQIPGTMQNAGGYGCRHFWWIEGT